MFDDPHVYKRPISRLRNSKRVLFCTNTSRRQTCPFLYLVNHDPRANTLYRILLSPERLPRNFDLAIRVTTTRNIPHDIDARLHNHQWFLIGQGRHPRRTIFIPSSHHRNVRPTEPHPADFVTVYMNDEDLPLPTPPRSEPTTESTNEAESSSDLARG